MTAHSPLSQIFPVGLTTVHSRIVTVELIKSFADIVGDYDPIHFDEEFCKSTQYGRPVAHGALLIGFMSAASTSATEKCGIPMVSLGYDRVRLIAPVFAGEEVKTTFKVTAHDDARGRMMADLTAHAGGRPAAVATNIIKVIS